MSELEKQAYELCLAIEQLPAGEYQTKLSVMASELLQNIRAAQQPRALDGAEFCPPQFHFFVDGECAHCGFNDSHRQ